MPNQNEIVDVLAMIEYTEANPGLGYKWKQDVWAQKEGCGTAMCAAGWSTHLAGAEMVYGVYDDFIANSCKIGRETFDIQALAQERMGITFEQGERLFDQHNDLDDLYIHAAYICGITFDELHSLVAERIDDVIPATMTLKERVDA